VHLHELAARAHDPVVVERVDDRDFARGGLDEQRRRQVVEVADVDDVGLDPFEQLREALIDPSVAVTVA